MTNGEICSNCGGDIYIDVTTYHLTWRCKKCKLWCQSPEILYSIVKLNKEEHKENQQSH